MKNKAQFSTVPKRIIKIFGRMRRGEASVIWPESNIEQFLKWEESAKDAVTFEIPRPDPDKERDSGWRELVIDQKLKGLFLPYESISVITKIANGEHLVVLARYEYDIKQPPNSERVIKDEPRVVAFRWFISEGAEWLMSPIALAVPNSIQEDTRDTQVYTVPLNGAVPIPVEAEKLMTYYTTLALRTLINLCTSLDVGREYITSTVYKEKSLTAHKQKGKKKKKEQFYEIHRLSIKPVVITTKPEPKGGTHASPRWHKRRGYWRTMKKSGKVVWVNSCEVGKKSNGMVYKDYEVAVN